MNARSDSPAEVFILGAGFSRAISASMPLTDDLGNEVLLRDKRRLGRNSSKLTFASGQFEAWLSRRAEPQPYLKNAADMENRAIFSRATELIAEVLDEHVEGSLRQPMPVWLGELISLWHLRKANVLTFNYDPLIECAFETMNFWDWRNESRFLWPSLINYSPEGKASVSWDEMGGDVPPHPSFRLWKLHGSLNWHWVPGDQTGATIRRTRLPGFFGDPKPVTSEELRWMAPGRERFIVPPAALKSGHYGNPLTREIWQRGYSALKAAGSVTLMGYSVPVTDLSTSGMLAEAFATRGERQVTIVDFNPASGPTSIASRIRGLGDFGVQVDDSLSGEAAIPNYVERLVRRASLESVQLLEAIARSEETRSLYIDWGEGRSAALTRCERKKNERCVVLHGEALGPNAHTTRSRGDGETRPLTLADMRSQLDGADRIVVRLPSIGREVSVIAVEPRTVDSGHGNGAWLQMIPAGASAG